MHADWFGNIFACGKECAEAHGVKGDDEMTLEEATRQYKDAVDEMVKHGAVSGIINHSKDIHSIQITDDEKWDLIVAEETRSKGVNENDVLRTKMFCGILFTKYELAVK
jgi:hypothetical protein